MPEICFQKAPGQDLAQNGRFPRSPEGTKPGNLNVWGVQTLKPQSLGGPRLLFRKPSVPPKSGGPGGLITLNPKSFRSGWFLWGGM